MEEVSRGDLKKGDEWGFWREEEGGMKEKGGGGVEGRLFPGHTQVV